jgi:ADP-ribose pyrophosphatase YjhB (NUDIX family)
LGCGESLEQAAAREALEETGLVVDPDRLERLSIVNMIEIEQVAVVFRIWLEQIPKVVPGVDCQEVAFIAESEIPISEWARLKAEPATSRTDTSLRQKRRILWARCLISPPIRKSAVSMRRAVVGLSIVAGG